MILGEFRRKLLPHWKKLHFNNNQNFWKSLKMVISVYFMKSMYKFILLLMMLEGDTIEITKYHNNL